MEELKPCPFCGNHDIKICKNPDVYPGDFDFDIDKCYYVQCSKCSCHYGYGYIDEAIKAWNTRPSEREKGK